MTVCFLESFTTSTITLRRWILGPKGRNRGKEMSTMQVHDFNVIITVSKAIGGGIAPMKEGKM